MLFGQVMRSVPAFFGKWLVMEDSTWQFEIDKTKGGRVFLLHDGCTHNDLVQMAIEDYGSDQKDMMVDLSYSLPEAMIDPKLIDTPPVFVSNDRGVRSLIEVSRMHAIRLCVSARLEMSISVGNVVEDDSCGEDEGATDEEEDEDDTIPNRSNAEVKEEESESDVDYSVYGRMNDSSDDESDSDLEDCIRTTDVAMGGIAKWSDTMHVNKGFSSKKEFETELKTIALMQNFPLKIYKSNKTFVVGTCRVKGCSWRARAGVKDEPNKLWVTKYVKTHSCSVSDRLGKRKACTPRHIAKLFIEHFGTIDGILPHHIRDSMRKLLKVKMGYTTSYRAMIHAQEMVRGSAKAGYENLSSYLYHLGKANPGSVTDLVCDAEGRFKYLFLALGASIAGFQYLRRVIVVDGTHLTGKCEGTLLAAS